MGPRRSKKLQISPELLKRILAISALTGWLLLQQHGSGVVHTHHEVASEPTPADAGIKAKSPNVLPPKPLPRQQTAKCPGSTKLINDGCWVKTAELPPCPPDQYEWEDKCYSPVGKDGMTMSIQPK